MWYGGRGVPFLRTPAHLNSCQFAESLNEFSSEAVPAHTNLKRPILSHFVGRFVVLKGLLHHAFDRAFREEHH
jgi:hypothetical protein